MEPSVSKPLSKNKKFIIISGVAAIILLLVIGIFASGILDRKENAQQQSNNDMQYSSGEMATTAPYSEGGGLLPANTCPDSVVNENGQEFGIVNGQKMPMNFQDFKYFDANCKNASKPAASASDASYGATYKALPECVSGQTYFDRLPAEVTALGSIIPLGNVSVPDHTIPTDHMYFILKRSSAGVEGKTIPSTVVSPGKIVVTGFSRTSESKSGKQITDDFAITFSACKGIEFYLGHVKTITNTKLNALTSTEGKCTTTTPATNTEVKTCIYATDLVLEANEMIGGIGSDTLGGFDFGAFSFKDKLAFANQGIHPPKTAYGLCPLDYFSATAKQQAYSIIGTTEKTRTVQPLCGLIMQDKVGTIQGNWYLGDTSKQETYSNWDNHLSIVHDNVDPTIGVFAIAGQVTTPKVVKFRPLASGTKNREPSTVNADGIAYCYESELALDANRYTTGSVLVQLVNEKQIKLEWRGTDCTSTNTFTSAAKEYNR